MKCRWRTESSNSWQVQTYACNAACVTVAALRDTTYDGDSGSRLGCQRRVDW